MLLTNTHDGELVFKILMNGPCHSHGSQYVVINCTHIPFNMDNSIDATKNIITGLTVVLITCVHMMGCDVMWCDVVGWCSNKALFRNYNINNKYIQFF